MRKTMHLILPLSLSILLFAAPKSHGQAQPEPSNAQKLDKLEAISKQLNLTPEQKVKLLPILKAEIPKMQAIKENTALTRLQKLEQIHALHEQTSPQVQAILSPQQYSQLQEIRQKEIQTMVQQKRAAQQ